MTTPSVSKILVLHGPNLNLLGQREPHLYGYQTLDQINRFLTEQAVKAGVQLTAFQSNHEGELVDRIQQARVDDVDFIVLNPAGFSHTSIVLRDALLATAIPFIEVHLTNIHRRESFRQHSYFSDIAVGVICGLGWRGYSLALDYALHPATNTNI
jgi:3-dehydroquinate dehydratase-2